MASAALDLRLSAESIGGVTLPFGSGDVETELTPPAVWNDPQAAGPGGAVITRSTETYAVARMRAKIGSLREAALRAFVTRASLPGYLGEPYTAACPQLGRIVGGQAFPAGSMPLTLASSDQEVELAVHVMDYYEIAQPAIGPLAG